MREREREEREAYLSSSQKPGQCVITSLLLQFDFAAQNEQIRSDKEPVNNVGRED